MKTNFLFLLLFPVLSFAQHSNKELIKKGIETEKHIPKGIEVGVKAPIINTTSHNGKSILSNEMLQNKQLVIIFYRGNWCPYCNRHLSNLNDSLKYIKEAGAEVLVIGPESFETAKETAEKSESSFILIPDTNMKIMEDFDVLFKVTKKYKGKIKTFLFTDIAKKNGQEEAMLPVPATYIIGKDGNVKWRHFDYDYTKRASAHSIINNLKE